MKPGKQTFLKLCLAALLLLAVLLGRWNVWFFWLLARRSGWFIKGYRYGIFSIL